MSAAGWDSDWMRLVAWNSCERFERNFAHLLELDFDVAVVSECGPLGQADRGERTLSSVMKLGVDQPGHTKHIGVFAREPWRVDALPAPPDQPWVLPVKVSGPVEFTLLAVWALGREYVPDRLSYAAQVSRVIAEVMPLLDGPVAIAGDFNAPIASDASGTRRHAENVAALQGLGLVSAFTATRGNVDPLSEPTLFHLWKEGKPFHIDHVFVPAMWTEGMSLEIGTYDQWVATKRSDHVPLIVDLPL